MMKRIVFISGTRADYGKIKTLMKRIAKDDGFDLHIFVTGMHLLSQYGSTYHEIEKDGFKNIYKFINQQENSNMDVALSNTILGFSNYVSEIKPDLIVVHGDRIEALAGALVGALNNIKVAHVEGGEISGTIDESIRHAITKFAHIHFVANQEAKERVLQLGEPEGSIYVIGSPDIDIMYSKNLPSLRQVKNRYGIDFKSYAIVMYHPVTTEVFNLDKNCDNLIDALIDSQLNYVIIYPNNDRGSSTIIGKYNKLRDHSKFKIFPSVRFEYFLTLLKNCDFIIGNSSAGIREASVYGIPSIDIGNRQKGRYNVESCMNVFHVNDCIEEMLQAINNIQSLSVLPQSLFGEGKSADQFIEIIRKKDIWDKNFQKIFKDLYFGKTIKLKE